MYFSYIFFMLSVLSLSYQTRTFSKVTFGFPRTDFKKSNIEKKDVTFRLFSEKYPNGKVLVEENAEELLKQSNIPAKVFIHNWEEGANAFWYDPLRASYLFKGNHNIIYVNWTAPASESYNLAAANTKRVGFFIADLIKESKLDLKNIHLIGFGLGAHIAGFAGKRIYAKTEKKISRITAADPSRVGFEVEGVSNDNRLSKDDADFIDVIHTDIAHYGFIQPIGKADFYFNAGNSQPGCPLYEFNDDCSHTRSIIYFIESVHTNLFTASKCSLGDTAGVPETVIFGDNVPTNASGTYCLQTSAGSPFAVGTNSVDLYY